MKNVIDDLIVLQDIFTGIIDLGIAVQGIFSVPRIALKDEIETGKLVEIFADWPKIT